MIKDKIKQIKYLRLSKVDKQILKIQEGTKYHWTDYQPNKPLSEIDKFFIYYNKKDDKFCIFRNDYFSHYISYDSLYGLIHAINILNNDH